jgi:hypothetical protein
VAGTLSTSRAGAMSLLLLTVASLHALCVDIMCVCWSLDVTVKSGGSLINCSYMVVDAMVVWRDISILLSN